jgi:hypothetical protein
MQRQQQGQNRDYDRGAVLAQTAGLDPELVDAIRERGGEAIAEWVDAIDTHGSESKLMRLMQQFSIWLEESVSRGQMPDQQTIMAAIQKLAQQYGVDPELATEFVMEVLQEYRQDIGQLRGGQQNATGNTGPVPARPNAGVLGTAVGQGRPNPPRPGTPMV